MGVGHFRICIVNDERVWIEKVERESLSCFWIGCVCLRVWCSVFRLVVWTRVTNS